MTWSAEPDEAGDAADLRGAYAFDAGAAMMAVLANQPRPAPSQKVESCSVTNGDVDRESQ